MPPPRTRPSVLLTTEGTYPFEGGGVTTWCDVILNGLPDIDVHLLAVTGSTALTLHKQLPPHVKTIQAVPLFGSVEPTEFTRAEEPFAQTVLRRARTTDALVERQFVPLLRQLLEALERPEEAGWNEARIIWEMNRYFIRLDHRATFRSESTWRAFRDTIRQQEADGGLDVRLDDLIRSLRWMYSFLLPITCPVPKTDVSHATLAGFAGLAGVIAKLEYGTPFMVTDHGIYLRERYIAMSSAEGESFFCKRFLLRLVHLVSRVCYVTADQISPVCDHNQRWELRMGATADKIRTIYNGIDTTLFTPPPPEKDAERTRPTVVTAARVFPLKDIETLIRACDVTRRRVPDVEFVVFGNNTVDKPYTDRCLALIDELGVGEHFTFAGYHSNPAELYHEGDVFALSSISEGFPFSVIEAMACERPVVATDVGGVKEALVGGVGIVVPPRGFEALGEGLADLLLDDDRRRELGRRSRERAVDQFGVERMLDAHRETYERFAGMELFPALTFVEDLAAVRGSDLGAVLARPSDPSLLLDLPSGDGSVEAPDAAEEPDAAMPEMPSDDLTLPPRPPQDVPSEDVPSDAREGAAVEMTASADTPAETPAAETAVADAPAPASGDTAWVARPRLEASQPDAETVAGDPQPAAPASPAESEPEPNDFWSWLGRERHAAGASEPARGRGREETQADSSEPDASDPDIPEPDAPERAVHMETHTPIGGPISGARVRQLVGDLLAPVSWEARARCLS